MTEKYITKENENYALLDKQTGELLKYNQVQKVTLDEFIMVFFSCYPNVFKLEGNQLKLLMCIWKYSSLNNDNQGNLFYNTAVFKQYVRDYGLDMSDSAINLYVSQLTKAGFLIKKCRSMYLLNPNYFFKGRLSDRTRIDYHIVVENKK